MFFTLIPFIDLFIDLRYYFDKNNEGLKVYKEILFFTFILSIHPRYYFETNNRGLKAYKQILPFTLTLFIDLFIDLWYYFDTYYGGLKV